MIKFYKIDVTGNVGEEFHFKRILKTSLSITIDELRDGILGSIFIEPEEREKAMMEVAICDVEEISKTFYESLIEDKERILMVIDPDKFMRKGGILD